MLQVGEQDVLFQDELKKIKRVFQVTDFKAGQAEIICSILSGNDVIASIPTWGGKSMCYQWPSSLEKTPSIVVSPLIALMEDQLNGLSEVNVPAYAIHSWIEPEEREARFAGLREWRAKLLYVSPELLATSAFYEDIWRIPFQRINIDEAHCASTWGPSFRPDFMRIWLAARRLKIGQRAAFSATIDAQIEIDIARYVGMKPGDYDRIKVDPLRENLDFSIIKIEPKLRWKNLLYTKLAHIYGELKKVKQWASIIYCRTVDEAFEMYRIMAKTKKHDVHLYHAPLAMSLKEEALEAFSNNPKPVVVATTAFWMGIDRADVRLVIQASTPYWLIDYYQGAGRAGRDGEPARCIVLYQKDKLNRETSGILHWYPSIAFVERVYEWLKNSISSNGGGADYSLTTFLRRCEKVVENSDKIKRPEEYMQKVKLSLHILQAGGVVEEHPSGVVFSPFTLGGLVHQRLIELCEMKLKAEERNIKMMMQYFEDQNPSQAKLLELLKL